MLLDKSLPDFLALTCSTARLAKSYMANDVQARIDIVCKGVVPTRGAIAMQLMFVCNSLEASHPY
jgi:hypothetical protein